VKRLSSEVQRFPTEGAQKWAYAEVFKGPLQGIASLTNEQAILAHLIRDRLQWAQGQPIEELEQGLSSVKSISGSAESGEVRLLTRAQQQITMELEKRPSGQVWTLAVFERGLTQYRDGLKDSLEVLEKNRAEWRRRMRLDLDLPKTP
jgi:hypothetical protein